MTSPETTARIDAPWLADPRLHRLFAAIEGADETCWVVGGAVRNSLLRLPVADTDVATTALPDVVMERAKAAGLKPIPTGIDHGTITVVVEGHPFEVTTLRRDVETHGRHATVVFGRDWSADAHRRDFTMNALYASLDGVVHDFVGGVADARARRVRFIGDADRRIAEDRLRILRFYRFHAAYGHGSPDSEAVRATIAARDGLSELSAERIGQELLKLIVAERAAETIAVMSDAGLLQRVLGRAADLGGFGRSSTLFYTEPDQSTGWTSLLLASLAAWTEGDALALAERLRLSNAMRDRMRDTVVAARRIGSGALGLLYAYGRDLAKDAVLLAWARHRLNAEERSTLLAEIEATSVPVLPIAGRDLVDLGLSRGPVVGRLLAEAEHRWIANGFVEDRSSLLKFCKLQIDTFLANE